MAVAEMPCPEIRARNATRASNAQAQPARMSVRSTRRAARATLLQDREMLYCLSSSRRVVPVAAVVKWSVGEWLSLVEHLVRDQGVGGSNPLSPTKYFAINQLRCL